MGCFWITGFFIVGIDYVSVRGPVSGQVERIALTARVSVLFSIQSNDNYKFFFELCLLNITTCGFTLGKIKKAGGL
jgi:hypothetical protein